MVSAQTTSMIKDSACISLHPLAESYVPDGNNEKQHRCRDKNKILHRHPQNFTSIAQVMRFSCLHRSGVNPGTIDPGGPWFPPAGVIPPEQVK